MIRSAPPFPFVSRDPGSLSESPEVSRVDPEDVPAAIAGRGEEEVLPVPRDAGTVLGPRRVDLLAQVDRSAPAPVLTPEGDVDVVPAGSAKDRTGLSLPAAG
jgi:hypothetical protein